MPLLENYPFIISGLKKKILSLNSRLTTSAKIIIESEQLSDEINYQHAVGLYEYYLYLRFFKILNTNNIHNLRLKFLIISLLLHTRKFNFLFLLSIILLPIIFYFLFVLIDYYEALEELFNFIKKK